MAHLRLIGLCLVETVLVTACGGSSDGTRGRPDADAMETAATAAAPVEPKVAAVMIGKRIGPGNQITEPSFEFARRDTVHLSVATEGDSGQLMAAWRSPTGQILEQSRKSVRSGENTAFQLSQPKGFKPGTYKVVLFLNQDSVDTKVFVVQK